jgi:hypothetical protein
VPEQGTLIVNITTPAELQATRQWLDLSRKELAHVTGDTESFIRNIEHPRALNLPSHVINALQDLENRRSEMINAWEPADIIVTFHSQGVFDAYALEWDMIAPTASFHMAVCSHIARLLQSGSHGFSIFNCSLVGFAPTIFAASEFGREDTMENRIAWARAWARQYKVTEDENASF